DRCEHRLFVMMENQSQNLDHLPVTARLAQQGVLELPEAFGHLGKRGAIAQSSWLALDHRQIMAPVINGVSLPMMPLDNPHVLADRLAFSDNDNTIWIDPVADWSVGERGRYTVANALEVNQAGVRDPFGVFDEPVKGTRQGHQIR